MRRLFCLAFFAVTSLPVFAASPTEVVGEYHAAVASGDTAKALSLLGNPPAKRARLEVEFST